MFYIGLGIGLFIGCFIGILIMALCIIAKKADEDIERHYFYHSPIESENPETKEETWQQRLKQQ
jgi:hypothetical protein